MNIFENFGLNQGLLNTIKNLGFTKPTQIQEQAIPHIIAGEDVIGESATGSGKTLAFGCGIVEKTIPNKGLQSLVLAPTRELVEQVRGELLKISGKKLRIITVYGGVSINPQVSNLRTADVVVATPGRLLDHLRRGTINVSTIKLLVLDEADRMLDMGFIEDVEKIVRQCNKQRQTLFFSATLPPKIKRLANNYMNNPVKVLAENMVDPSKLKQVYYDVSRDMKFSLLVHLLTQERAGLVIVFCNTRTNTDYVVKNLRVNNIDAIAIHGGFAQNKRTRTLQSFNDAKFGVLVCTDVASRGLHIDNVSHVYNYDLPKDAKDYVHRIGRTARAGEEGKAVNILCDLDYDNFSRILDEYRDFKIKKEEKPEFERVKTIQVQSRRKPFTRGGRANRPGQRRFSGGRDRFSKERRR
ncbi:ATP-dependent RNA helicase [Candidatus Woesearchaeota archaeon CG10_big_fil_rev_8_21_14_0_10_30_7]|nr:MAG: ATP-dependent RNA helicase [Candidatus Woesearchaeota archaeon CG10_big_fil_rev_8_21_14_0_10_30_7]